MVYCYLKGGLGNIMFQIAATISMAVDKGVEASFPNLMGQLQAIDNDRHFNPTLRHSIEYMCIFDGLLTNPPPPGLKTYPYPFHYDPMIPEETDFIIDGFFQSEDYFKHNEVKVREVLGVPKKVSEIIESKYRSLFNVRTTGIHVRRGDYLRYQSHHPTQSLQYYEKGIQLFNDTEKFIIFSDDIGWCKENFIGDQYFFVEGEKDYVEIYLMSMCDNVITSNSSFSWWGAWLNDNDTMVGPNLWFGPAITFSDKDIIPKTWTKF